MAKKPKKNLPSRLNNPPQASQPNIPQLVAARLESFSGPLPDPSTLKRFDEVLPGTAERIIIMAEQQQSHRQMLEKTVVIGDGRRAMFGLGAGLFVAIAVLGVAAFLIYNGHDAAGTIIGGLDIVSLVAVFVYGSVSRRAERSGKAPIPKQAQRGGR